MAALGGKRTLGTKPHAHGASLSPRRENQLDCRFGGLNPFPRLGWAAAVRTEEVEAVVELGRLRLPRRCFHPGTLSAVVEAAAGRAALPESAFRQGKFASQAPEALSRKPKA